MTQHHSSKRHGMGRIAAGASLPVRRLISVQGEHILIPHPDRMVHLQFRRFAGCPICKLHLRSIAERHAEIAAAGILEVAVFHSSTDAMKKYEQELPFSVVADPALQLYRAFGVESSLRSVLDPRAWRAIWRGLSTFGMGREPGEPALGLPADFMISPRGIVVASKYGSHADDHWPVDEILAIARQASRSSQA